MTTQKTFEQLKELVEDIVGTEFADNEAYFDEDGYYFDKRICSEHRVTLCFNYDRSTEIWIHSETDESIEICSYNEENNNLVLNIFAHIINYN